MKKILLFQLVLILSLLIGGCCNKADKTVQEETVTNVIYMIGDGMGVAQITELIMNSDSPVNMTRATKIGLVKTSSANNRVTDSAAAGTALATGTKTNNGRLGLDPDGNELSSIMSDAIEKGLSTGFVVTCIATHATPAAFYAHTESRHNYETIAEQLTDSGIEVFFGAGRNNFDRREDGQDLIAKLENSGYKVIFDFDNAAEIESGKVAALLTEKGSMAYNFDGRGDYLPRATAKALEILSNNSDKGFMLMVEGSLIDYAGHANDRDRLHAEMKDFDDAVGVAFDYADRNPGTLVVVLADHETGGLSLPSGSSDYTAGESGMLYNFGTDGHSATMIAMFAYGTGADKFTGVFDNTEIPKIIAELQGLR